MDTLYNHLKSEQIHTKHPQDRQLLQGEASQSARWVYKLHIKPVSYINSCYTHVILMLYSCYTQTFHQVTVSVNLWRFRLVASPNV